MNNLNDFEAKLHDWMSMAETAKFDFNTAQYADSVVEVYRNGCDAALFSNKTKSKLQLISNGNTRNNIDGI
ncbi:hypothetical protein B9Z55_003195 [Caenorhabditis nigoni]|uniref:Uncharacterized protein n=1 Tax=Caenorhabditis nigoni TaxID=1611254 RepID=A0A2G5VNZ1_9PELO|nr:hypothetical protein B9Z55_003195 [Caenorhabditis nigoni]